MESCVRNVKNKLGEDIVTTMYEKTKKHDAQVRNGRAYGAIIFFIIALIAAFGAGLTVDNTLRLIFSCAAGICLVIAIVLYPKDKAGA